MASYFNIFNLLFFRVSRNLQFERPFEGPEEVRQKLLKEIETLRGNYQLEKKREAEKVVPNVELIHPLQELSWEAVGEALLKLRANFIAENESAVSIFEESIILLKSALDSVGCGSQSFNP